MIFFTIPVPLVKCRLTGSRAGRTKSRFFVIRAGFVVQGLLFCLVLPSVFVACYN